MESLNMLPDYENIKSFMDWKEKQRKTKRGGKIMYDVKGHYKYMYHGELFSYWCKNVK